MSKELLLQQAADVDALQNEEEEIEQTSHEGILMEKCNVLAAMI
jgi:hypothetical protein